MKRKAHNSITQIAHKRNPPKAHKRIIPNNSRHTATLKRFYFTHRRLPQSVTQTPMKERKKGSHDFPFVVAGESSPTTISVVPPGPDSVCGRRTLSGTSHPDARVLCATGAVASLDRASSGSAARQVDHSPGSATTNHSTTFSSSLTPRPKQRLEPF